MKKILGVIDAVSNWSGKISSFIVVLAILIIDYEVIARYVFNAPTVWGTEATTIVCGIYFIMGGAYALMLKMHVSVDIIYANLSGRKKAIIDLITSPIIFLYMVILVWTGGVYAWESLVLKETTGTAANLPFWPLKVSFFVAALLMFFQMLAKSVRDIQMVVFGRKAS